VQVPLVAPVLEAVVPWARRMRVSSTSSQDVMSLVELPINVSASSTF
jgi:hypothetical protein